MSFSSLLMGEKMKKMMMTFGTLLALSAIAAQENRVLVAYFSKTGNTEILAKEIAAETGGTLARIRATQPYPADKKANMERTKAEYENGARPAIECDVLDVSDYDVIFVGYPLWCAKAPAPIFTFLESHDLSGKKIVPFVTYGGSPFARGTEDIRLLAPEAEVSRPIAVRASRVSSCGKAVRAAARKLIAECAPSALNF